MATSTSSPLTAKTIADPGVRVRHRSGQPLIRSRVATGTTSALLASLTDAAIGALESWDVAPRSGSIRVWHEMAKVDLEFLARQIERVITDLATLKDDAMVVMARLDQIDATVQSLVVEVRAMHSRLVVKGS